MLDVLHIPKASAVRGTCAWHGGRRVLAGRIVGEDDVGEGGWKAVGGGEWEVTSMLSLWDDLSSCGLFV